MSIIKMGLPSKGRLQNLTFDWLASLGIEMDSEIDNREYSARLIGNHEINIFLMSAAEIPRELAAGNIDLGITGLDLIREKIPFWKESVLELKMLDFGHSKLVLSVPEFWADVETLDDFDAVAVSFRKNKGFRLRIATKYHNLVRAYLRKMGVADYQLVDSQGATEGTIKNKSAEAIADITSSGETLIANHLKVIGEDPILISQATIFVSKSVVWTEKKYKVLEKFCTNIGIDSQEISCVLKNT